MMVTSAGSYVVGGNPGESRGLPTPPPERTPDELAAWRARNEAKATRNGIHRATSTAGYQSQVTPTPDPAPAPPPQASSPVARPKPKPSTPPAVDSTRQRDAAIVTAYTAGDTIPTIARARGHSTSTVRRVLLAAGVELRDDRTTHSGQAQLATEVADPRLLERIRSLIADGHTGPEIADDLGLPPSTLSRNGITLPHRRRDTPETVANRSAAFDAYRREIADAGATAALLREFAASTGVKVSHRGIPPRSLFQAWLDAGKPTDFPPSDEAAAAAAAPVTSSSETTPALLDEQDVPIPYTVTTEIEAAWDADAYRLAVDHALTPSAPARGPALRMEHVLALNELVDLIARARQQSAYALVDALEAAAVRVTHTICAPGGPA